MSETPPNSPGGRKPNFDDYPRVLGVILLVLGLICGLVGFYFPIQDAMQGAAKISVPSKAIAGFVIFSIMGLTLIILGPIAVRLAYWGVALKRWKRWMVVGLIMIFFIGAMELVERVFQQYLETFGYKF